MKLLGLLLVCVAVVSCVPPYIAELDSSATLTRQMTMVGTIGPLNSGNGNRQVDMRFLPAKPTAASIDAINVTSGFTVTESADTDYLQFMYMDSSGNVQLTGGQPFSLVGADPNYPLYEFDVTTTTTTANIVVLNLIPNNPAASQAALYKATLPTGPFVQANSTILNTSVFAAPLSTVLGVQMVPQLGSPDTSYNFLLWDGSSSWGRGSTTADVGGLTFATATATADPPPFTIPVRRALYYQNASKTLSYASYFQGIQWVCDRWTLGTSRIPLAGVTHRIDAVLTSGDLVSTEGGVLRLYDPNGTLLESVSLGGLQFCYEAYVGSTPCVFFSLSMDMGRGTWAFRAYAVPTSSVRSLGG